MHDSHQKVFSLNDLPFLFLTPAADLTSHVFIYGRKYKNSHIFEDGFSFFGIELRVGFSILLATASLTAVHVVFLTSNHDLRTFARKSSHNEIWVICRLKLGHKLRISKMTKYLGVTDFVSEKNALISIDGSS